MCFCLQAAKETLEAEHKDLKIYIVPPNSAVTMDWRTDRVRLYCDDAGKVEKTPRLG